MSVLRCHCSTNYLPTKVPIVASPLAAQNLAQIQSKLEGPLYLTISQPYNSQPYYFSTVSIPTMDQHPVQLGFGCGWRPLPPLTVTSMHCIKKRQKCNVCLKKNYIIAKLWKKNVRIGAPHSVFRSYKRVVILISLCKNYLL